jgi:hypothetical protein
MAIDLFFDHSPAVALCLLLIFGRRPRHREPCSALDCSKSLLMDFTKSRETPLALFP